MASANFQTRLRGAGLPAAAAALLALHGCGGGEQSAPKEPAAETAGTKQRQAEQEEARQASDKARRNSEADARSATRVKADMERFERSERESGR